MSIDKTLEQRGDKYGSFVDNATMTQSLMRVIQCHPGYDKLSDCHKEAFHMIFHKISRCVCGDVNYIDNIHDIVGYAKLLENFLTDKEEKNG